MVLGILIFVAGYTWLDYSTAKLAWRRNRRLRRTLRIAYGTRIAISILFPLGGTLDVICGLISMQLTAPFTGLEAAEGPGGFFSILLITLVQGCVLNLVLGSYALLVYGVQVLIGAVRKSSPVNVDLP